MRLFFINRLLNLRVKIGDIPIVFTLIAAFHFMLRNRLLSFVLVAKFSRFPGNVMGFLDINALLVVEKVLIYLIPFVGDILPSGKMRPDGNDVMEQELHEVISPADQ